MSETDLSDRVDRTLDWLAMIRAVPRLQLILVVLGVLVGAILALEHWLGFVFMGLVIGLVSRTLGQAIVTSFAVGAVAIVAFLGYAWRHDQLTVVLSLGELTLISVLIPVALIVLGSLVRGVT